MPTVTIRLPPKLAQRLAKATDRLRDPMAPSKSQILLGGLEIMLYRIEQKKGSTNGR